VKGVNNDRDQTAQWPHFAVLGSGLAHARGGAMTIVMLFMCMFVAANPSRCTPLQQFSNAESCDDYLSQHMHGDPHYVCMKKTVPAWEPVQ